MPENNVCVIGYVPPPSFGYPEAFLKNLDRFPTHYPLILYSDHDYGRPGMIKLKWNPETVGETGNKWALNNLLFYTALRIARDYTHILYIESDSRVGCPGWDKIIFDEFFAAGEQMIMGGSVVAYSPCNHSMEVMRKWADLCAKYNTRKNFPIPTYGAGGAAERAQPCFLVNGSLGVYTMDWMMRIFGDGLESTPALARATVAWDFEIGMRLFNMLGTEQLDRVAHLSSLFSSYGDILTTENDRRMMLHRGERVAVHQIKSDWEGPEFPANTFLRGDGTWVPASQISDNASTQAMAPVAVKTDPQPEPAADVISEPAQVTTGSPNPQGVVEPIVTVDPTKTDELGRVEVTKTVQRVETIEHPRTEIFIVTFGRDVGFNAFALESIKKFASGFSGVTVLVPGKDKQAFLPQCKMFGATLKVFNQASDRLGFLDHEVQVCRADYWCPKAHFILHFDADCIFTGNVTPDTYFKDGKPILWMERFESFRLVHPTRYIWKSVAEKALGFDVEYETMCRHPAVHPRYLYPAVRTHIEKTHGQEFRKWVLDQQPDFPHGFAEFPTLGAYARIYLHGAYHFFDVTGLDDTQKGPSYVKQFNGRGPLSVAEAEIKKILRG